jgi:hypothetical protein
LVLAGVSGFRCFDAVRLEGLALYREVLALVGDDEIAFPASVMVVGFVDIIIARPGKVHLPQFVFRDIAEHEAAHTGVLLDDIGKLLLRQVPSFQYAFTFVRRHVFSYSIFCGEQPANH